MTGKTTTRVVWHDDSWSDWALRKAVELKGQDRSLISAFLSLEQDRT